MMALVCRLSPRARVCSRALVLCSILLVLTGATSHAAAQSWRPLPEPPQALEDINATLLQDGRVLIVGRGGLPLLFDSRDGTWSLTVNAPFTLSRGFATCITLPNGNVLVTGGDGFGIGANSYQFDPRSNTWSVVAPPLERRVNAAASVLPDGRILVSGGSLDNPGVGTTEIYDSSGNTWTAGPDMHVARSGGHLTTLLDGRVLAVGNDGAPDIFDPTTSTFVVGTSSAPRTFPGSLLLPNGNVLIVGDSAVSGVTSAQLFTGSVFASTGAPIVPIKKAALALLPDGRVLSAGGSGVGVTPDTQIYDPASEFWSAGPAMSTLRVSPRLVTMPDGRVIAFGGNLGGGAFAEVFDPLDVSSTTTAAGMGARSRAAARTLPDGRVFIAGGMTFFNSPFLDDAKTYDPATDTWSALPSMAAGRGDFPEALLLRDGRVMVLGGTESSAAVDLYDPAAGTHMDGPSLNAARAGQASAILSNGWVLTTGGSGSLETMTSAELFMPEAHRWLTVAPMTQRRRYHAAVRLPDDRVLVIGGQDENGSTLTSATIYDYKTNTWTATGAISAPLTRVHAFLLPNGRVLALGFGGNSFVWDPGTGAWTDVGMATSVAIDRAPTQLPSGEVVTFGGYGAVTELDEITVFDPATTAWRSVGVLQEGRANASAATLPDGRVLVMGGERSGGTSFDTPEIVSFSRGRDASRVPVLNAPGPMDTAVNALLLGTGFQTMYAAAANGATTTSPSNYPLVSWRSLTTNESTILPLVLSTDTLAGLFPLHGFPLGPSVLRVITNGIASDPRTVALGANVPTVTAAGASVTYNPAPYALPISATVASAFPPATGVIWFFVTDSNGVLLGPPIPSSAISVLGVGSVTWTVPAGLAVGDYTVTAVFTGTGIHAPAADTATIHIAPAATTLTVTPVMPTMPRRTTVSVAANVVEAGGGGPVASGTIALTNGVSSCSFAAPSGACDLSFPHAGTITVSGTYTPALPAYALSNATASVDVTCTPTLLTPADLLNGRVDQPYAVTFTASGGVEPYDPLVITAGTLPAGLTLTGHTISGTPTTAGTSSFSLQTRDADHCLTATGYTLTIDEAPQGPTERVYTLAEGVSNSFFSSFILIANPNAEATPITVTFAGDTGETTSESHTLAPFSRLTIATGPGSTAAGAGALFATRVSSTTRTPLIVERATYFDGTLHAGDLSTATDGEGRTTWLFAEGANGYFHTYLTFGNLQDQDAAVTVRYLPEGGAPIERQYTVPRHSRQTIDTPSEAGLATAAFATTVESSVPIAADRVQYFGSPFIGAHADSGAHAPSADWYFAEGASGQSFDTYLLLANPSRDTAATATVTYHADSGDVVTRSYTLAPGSRRSIDVAGEDTSLKIGTFWMHVQADRPIVAERAMYLAGASGWTDATATTGATAPAVRWGFAEAVSGKALGYAPYIMVANPTTEEAALLVQYLRTTGEPVSRTYTLAGGARLTIDVRHDEPSLSGTEFGIVVSSTNDIPVVAERSLYWTLGGSTFVGAMNTMGTPLPSPRR